MYKELFLLAASIVLASAVPANSKIACTKDICTRVKCAAVHCIFPQVVKKKGGFCGCSDSCITLLKMCQSCRTPFRGIPPTSECGQGLVCDPDIWKCVPRYGSWEEDCDDSSSGSSSEEC